MSWNTWTPSRNVDLRIDGTPFPGGTDQALEELLVLTITEGCDRGDYKLRSPGCWGASNRTIAGTTILSFHGKSGGRAVDVNAPWNGRGTRGDIPDEFVHVMESFGFVWGGRWSYTDPMHFEWRGSAKAARRALARAKRMLTDDIDYRVGDKTFGQLTKAMSYLRGKLTKGNKGDDFHITLVNNPDK